MTVDAEAAQLLESEPLMAHLEPVSTVGHTSPRSGIATRTGSSKS